MLNPHPYDVPSGYVPLEDVDAPAGDASAVSASAGYAVDESVHALTEGVYADYEGDVYAEVAAREVAALGAETADHNGEAPVTTVDDVCGQPASGISAETSGGRVNATGRKLA